MSDLEAIERQLIRDEGLRLKPYKDTVGKLTIGVGHNLDDNGIRESEARFILRNDVLEAISQCRTIPCFSKLNEPRQAVLANLCFNIGINRLYGFKKMLAALEDMDYNTAAHELQDSLWYKQVGIRAIRLTQQLKSGVWVE